MPTTTGRDRASGVSRARVQLAISLVHKSRSQTNDRGIWPENEASCTHAYNGVLHNGQQLQTNRVLCMAFVDHGEFEAMKTPIGRRAPRCDKDQICA